MPQFFLNKKLISILIGIIIVVLVVGYTARDRLGLTWPEQFMKDTIAFMQKTIDKPITFVSNIFSNMSELDSTYEENQKLKAKLEENIRLQTKVYELEQELEELKRLSGFEGTLNHEVVATAMVIQRPYDLWSESIVIDKGSSHGIEVNMPVMTAEGLVGRVKETTKFTATVQLLTSLDNRNRISTYVQGKKEQISIIQGYDLETKTLQLYADKEADLKVDSNVVTSGQGGVFPSGLPIGKVKKVGVDRTGLSTVAHVEPNVNFSKLIYVDVVRSPEKSILSEVDSSDEEDL